MNTVGQGVKEIRIRDASGAFRVIYVAKFADAVYVLHCFQKKTEKTRKTDLDLAAKRYRDLLKELGACRTLGVESEKAPQRDQFLPDSQPHSGAMGQEDGKKWAAAAHSQPTIPKSDRLLDQ